MICNSCGAYLIDGTNKCPFCKEVFDMTSNSNSDVTYKIESEKQYELIKNSARRPKSSKTFNEKKRKKRNKRIVGYAVLSFIAILLISLIFGLFSLIIYLFSDKTVYSTAYLSENKIEVFYEGKNIVLSDKAFLKEDEENVVSENCIKKSENGKTTVFLDNFDSSKNCGRLKVMTKDRAENIITVSENVSPDFHVSADGEYIAYIKNANQKGNQGELWVYETGEDSVKVSEKVDADKFLISSENDKVVYIKNYDYQAFCGDAYYSDFSGFAENKFASAAYMIHGLGSDGKTIIYSKDYNNKTGLFNIWAYKNEKETVLIKNSDVAPVFSENLRYSFACGDKLNDRYSLYRIDTKKQNSEKIINNMSEIQRVSAKGDKIVYSKKFDNNVSDYYIWTEGETELKVADGVNYTHKNQVSISEDFSVVTYITNYSEEKKGGTLYHCIYEEDSVSIPDKISDDVYNCFVLNNEKIVYTKNYSEKANSAELYIFNGIETEINSEINPNYLEVNDRIFCLFDYKAQHGGNLYSIDENLKEKRITTDVFDFYFKENGEILLIKSFDYKDSIFDLYETNKDEIQLIKKDVKQVLFR